MSETSSTSARSSGLVARAFLFTRTRPLIAIALHLVACVFTAGAAKDFLLGASLRDAAVAQAIMASCIPGIIAAQCVQPASRDRELCWPHRTTGRLRLALALWLVLLPVACRVIASLHGSSWLVTMLYCRNVLLLTAVSLLSAQVLPGSAAWAPSTIYSLACWFLGTMDLAGTAEPWALVNMPYWHRPTLVLTALLTVAALVLARHRCPRG